MCRISYLKIGFFCLFLTAFTAVNAQNSCDNSSKIREALSYQLENYPFSEYRDVYKNFMQDYFGPGHLLNDTVAAGNYLRKEIAETEIFGGPDFEKTGFNGNFYRVNLRLIANGAIPYQTFFDAFVESVRNITPPSGEEWLKIWNAIDREIIESNLHFPNEQEDRDNLSEQFEKANYIAHHSRSFDENSNFHYRIISKELFETVLAPFLNPKN